MKFTATAAGLLAMGPLVSAHTLFSRFFVDGESQGDGTCIRLPEDGSTSTAPINGLNSNDMACGRDGEIPAAYVCPTSASATLTFEFREWPDASQGGAIDGSHRGPCAVYVKRVNDMFSDPAAGPGWTKIWHEGYDEDAGQWCTEKLIANKGLLSVELPSGLPAGYYLVRPELLALHQAASLNDPQYYVSCAQIYIQDGPSTLNIPSENTVSIPGYVDGSEPGNRYNLYTNPLALPYPIPGPEPFSPVGSTSGSASLNATEIDGAIPGDCIVKNCNWCGRPLESYSSSTGCWAAVEACFKQGTACYEATNPTGNKNCERWNQQMCHAISDRCRAGDVNGPPNIQIEEYDTARPAALPAAVNQGAGNGGSNPDPGSGSDEEEEEEEEQPSSAPVSAPSPVASSLPEEGDITPTAIFSTIYGDVPTPATTTDAVSSAAPVSPPAATPEPGSGRGLIASPDGTCGGDTGYTCEGSRFGGCCSRFGRCGRRSRACGCHCQPLFGRCNEPVSEA